MDVSIATVVIEGVSALSQSRGHDELRFERESPGDYDARTWRAKLNTSVREGKPTVVIPAHGMHQAIASAARYSKRQIPGQGKATWTAKFTAGIMLAEDPALGVDPGSVGSVLISANADGVRGSGKRVPRRFPIIPPGWRSTFDVYILDPIIIEPVFREMMDLAGMFIGVGRFRPEKGGTNGRFRVVDLSWQDNRRLAA